MAESGKHSRMTIELELPFLRVHGIKIEINLKKIAHITFSLIFTCILANRSVQRGGKRGRGFHSGCGQWGCSDAISRLHTIC